MNQEHTPLFRNFCFTLLCLLLTSFVASTQNVANYTFSTNTSSSLAKDLNGNTIDMTTGTTQLVGPGMDATASPAHGIGFTFFFMGRLFTQFAVQDDGIVQLGGGIPQINRYDLSSGLPTSPWLSAFCADLRTGTNTGEIRYKLIGALPNRVLVIEFKEMQLFYSNVAAAGSSTYQVRLYENGNVEYVYGRMSVTNISTSNMNPSIGFYIDAGAGSFASVAYATHTVASTGPYSANPSVTAIGPIPELNATSDSTCRAYVFVNNPSAATPTNLTFTNVGGSTVTLNWIDSASNENGYYVYRSDDGGLTYNLQSMLDANSTTCLAVGLMPYKKYYWHIVAYVNGGISNPLSGSQTTANASLVKSTKAGGNWNDTATWIGGIIPTIGDSAVIADSATVIINYNTPTCYSLTVGEGTSGKLLFDSAQAATLTVTNNVYVVTNGIFTAGTGSQLGHNLQIGGVVPTSIGEGSLKVDGVFDMQTSAGVAVSFFGVGNAKIEGTPTVLDFRGITVSKGASAINRSVLEILTGFTVQGGNTLGLISSHTAGLIRIGGTYTQSNPIYTNPAYTIPVNGGLHLNNPNFTVVSSNGNSINNGLLQVTQGVFNVGQTAAHRLNMGTGAVFTVEGGLVNAAGIINISGIITFNFTGGVIKVATVGNSSSTLASFGITFSSSTVNWIGGTLILEQKANGASSIDYQITPPYITGNVSGILQIGGTTTAANTVFNIRGSVPNLVVDSLKTATLTAQLNVFGDILVKAASVLKLNSYSLIHSGSTVINNGFIDGRVASSNWEFSPSITGHTYSGMGVDTLQKITSKDTNAIVLNKPIVAYGLAFNGRSAITHSNFISLGNGLTQAVTVQVGIAGYTDGNVGIFDTIPTYNLGTGAYHLSYFQEGATRTTGLEIPPTRSIYNLVINNSYNITLAGGALDINGIVSLVAGRFITSAVNLPKVLTTGTSSVVGGSTSTYIDGPLQRRLPANFRTTSIYAFPIGKGSSYNRMELISPYTNTGGTVDVLVESFNTLPSGGVDAITMDSLLPRYWTVSIPNGKANIDSANVKLYGNDLTILNKMAYADSVSGLYRRVSNAPVNGFITSNRLIGDTAIEGVFAIGEVSNVMSGTFLVGANKVAPHYKSLTAAMANIAERRLNGNVTLLLDSDYTSTLETFPISFNPFIAADSNISISIKPQTGVSPSIVGSSATTLIRFTDGAKNYVFDGSNNGTSSKNIFIQNTNVAGAVVMFQGLVSTLGVKNSILKNTLIKGGSNVSSLGIIVGSTTVSIGSGGVGHKNLLIKNNTIYNCNDAVVINGLSGTSKIGSIVFSGNTIGTDSVSFYNRRHGIYTANTDSLTIENNTIYNQKTSAASLLCMGMNINIHTTNCEIKSNTVKGIHSTGVSAGAYGICINGPLGIDNISIINNAISNLLTSNNSINIAAAPIPNGIRLNGGNNVKLYFNTVHLYGTPSGGTGVSYSAALFINQTVLMTGLDIRNNIFSNNINGVNATSKQYALALNSSSPLSGALFDFNNFVANSAQGILMYNSVGALDYRLLDSLKTSTNANTNSVSINPQFLNDSNLVVGYGALTGLGTTISGVTVDIEDSVRSAPPTIGAYERKVDIAGPDISYTPLTKSTELVTRVLPALANITDFSGVDTSLAKPRIYFRKSSNANVFGSYPENNDSTFNGWKYVEATNTISPFSFTIDYRLLTNGSVSLWDTIVYFVAAQDNAGKVSAIPALGFGAISVDSVTSAPIIPNRYVIYDTPLAGSYLVGLANSYPNFNTISAALSAMQIRGIGAPVVLQLTDSVIASPSQTFPITLNPIEGSTVANTVTLKPASGKRVAIIGSSASGLINLSGVDNFIIDGSNNGTTSQELFVQNTNTAGAGIMFQGTAANQGVQNSVLKNTIIKGGSNNTAYGVIIGGTAVGVNSNGIGNKNILIKNNAIYNCNDAVVVSGTFASRMSNVIVSGNIIGTDSASFYNRRSGIHLVYADSTTISHNAIVNIKTNAASIQVTGISMNPYTTNCIVSGNIIKGMYSEGVSGAAYGIHLINTTTIDNIRISNNTISDIVTSNNGTSISASNNAVGIRIAGGTNIKLYFNTVNLYGRSAIGTLPNYSSALTIYSLGAVTGFDIRNNIFSNSMTGVNSGSKHYALVSYNSFASVLFDYNNFVTNSSQGNLMYNLAAGGHDVRTLDSLKIVTGANLNSVNINPQFVNDSNLMVGYGALTGLGTPITDITVDIDDSLRSNPPTPGAYERKTDMVGPAIQYTPLSKSYQDSIRVLTDFAKITDYGGVDTTTAKPRLYFRKSTEANVFGTYPQNNDSTFNGWKYVEATNTTSPFSFAIDYAKLTTGGVSLWDTIVYFLVARDIDSIVSANPSLGFVAVNYDFITSAPITPNRYIIYDRPLAGPYLVGVAQTYPNFSSINKAVSALHVRGIGAPVELQLTDSVYSAPTQTFPIAFNPIVGSTSANTITIKPASGKRVAIIGTSTSGLINLNGVDNIIIDGSNNGTTSQDLFIQNTGTNGVGLMFQGTTTNNGVENSILKNTIIKGGSNATAYGVIVGGTTVGLASGGAGHKNLVIEKNTIYNCRDAVLISGTSATIKVIGVTVKGNTIGTDSSSFYGTRSGIYVTDADSIVLSNNTVKNVRTSLNNNSMGIMLMSYTTNSTVSANIIKGIYATNSIGYSSFGIAVESAYCDNININNNVVSNIKGTLASSSLTSLNATGIRINGGSNIKLYFNTVHLWGVAATTAANSSAALSFNTNSLTGLDIRNNIFSNSMTGTNSGSKHTAISCFTPFPTSVFDYNDFVTNSTQGILMASSNGTTTTYTPTLAGLQTVTNANANSVNIDPLFVNDSNLITNTGTVESLGIAIPNITLDIRDSVRSVPPTLGAYDKAIDLRSPTITYTTLDTTTQLVNRTFSVTITDFSGVDTTTAKPRVYYRKQTDANIFGSYPADNNASFNGWKYVEASNTSSPFNFTIDYSLLTSGSISIWETIEYFVVAQDVTVLANISANPSIGFVASSINNITSGPITPNRYLVKDVPLAGIYNVGSAYSYPHFATLHSAVDALHSRGVGGAVVLQLTDANYTISAITINEIVGASATNTITIKPASGNKAILTGSSSTGLINLNGTDYIIIDGSNNGTKTQDLFVQNIYSGGAGIMFQGTIANQGSQNSILKNTIIKGGSNTLSYGLLIGGTSVGLASNGVGHNNLVIQNNTIYNCAHAVVLSGSSSTNKVRSVTLLNNTIGTDTSTFYNTKFGIYSIYTDSLILSHNTIKNLKATSSVAIFGIFLTSYTTNCKIRSNIIKGIYSTYAFGGVLGINIAKVLGVDNVTISNNAICDIISDNTGGNDCGGICISSGNDIKLYHNTVNLYTTLQYPSNVATSAALMLSNTITGLDIRNNIFSNSIVGTSPTVKQYSLYCVTPFSASIFDYNNFVANSFQGVLMRGISGPPSNPTFTDYTTLTALRTVTNGNTNSMNMNPSFVNDSNLIPSLGAAPAFGIYIPEIVTDLLDSVRSNPPMMGAYEHAIDGSAPTIVYDRLFNDTVGGSKMLIGFASITDFSGVNTTAAKPRLYFKRISEASIFGNYPADNNTIFDGWKYVEASNIVSPFNFTIDYALLTNGGVSLWDTIQYFVVAQDIIDSLHVSSNPLTGFVATSINNITSAPLLPNYYIIAERPLAGNYFVGANQTSPNFSSIKEALKALNLNGVKAPVVFQLTDSFYTSSTEVFPMIINEISGSSPLNTVTIKPSTGKRVAIIGPSDIGVITLKGSDNIIIDGSNNGTNSQDLFIQNTSASRGAVIMFQGTTSSPGSKNSTLKNTILKGGGKGFWYNTFGLVIGGQTADITDGGGHDNLSIQNNLIYNCGHGILLSGAATLKVSKIDIKDNTIGIDSNGLGIGETGVYIKDVDSITVIRNIVKNVSADYRNCIGIFINGNTTNSEVSKNVISGIAAIPIDNDYNDEVGAFGIKVSSGLNNNIVFGNNVITNIFANDVFASIQSQPRTFGIKIGAGNSIKLYFNSVHLVGHLERGSSVSLYVNSYSSTSLDIRNNIFSNEMTSSSSNQGRGYTFFSNTATAAPYSIFDYNNFTVSGNAARLMATRPGSTLNGILTLADLRTATGANTNSVSIVPLFASYLNLTPGGDTLKGMGVTIPGILFDIVDSIRSNPPAIGAYENGKDISGPEISYTQLANIKSLANRELTGFATITDHSGFNTTTAKPRLYYRKSTDANVFGTYPVNNIASFNGWKYVEATNNVSPFDFTIDYARLTSGHVSELDTIFYFVVAEDLNTPESNISANPSDGFSAARVDSVIHAPTTPNAYIIDYIPLAGNYLVGAGQTTPNFPTITAAVNALNLKGISAAVVFQLTSTGYSGITETFPITINEIVGADTNNTITFKPFAGNTATITGALYANALINFNGTDYIIFDGSNNGTSSRNLVIRNTHAGGYGVWFQGDTYNQGAQHSVFKNITIKGSVSTASFGIIIGGTTPYFMLGGIGKGGTGHDDLLIQNNTIYNCLDALVVSGISDLERVRGVKIIGNTIGVDTVSLPNARNGIYMQFNDGITISKNTIKNVKNTSVFYATGINLKDFTSNCTISGNTIRGIYAQEAYGHAAIGINVGDPFSVLNNITLSNNAISDIMATNYSVSPYSNRTAYGIRLGGVLGVQLYFNTVHLYGQPTVGNNMSSSVAMMIESAENVYILNNIFSNSMTGKIAGSKHYALCAVNAYFPNYTFDYNNFIANSVHGVLMADSMSASDITTLAGLQAVTGNIHSLNMNPQFVSNTNLTIGANTLQNLGVDLTSLMVGWGVNYIDLTNDIVDSLRSNPPSIGAYEGPGRTIPVPVTLLSFTAHAKQNNVELHWSTASELNNKGFEVERSVDGRNFEKINFVKGVGESSTTVDYRLTDENAFAAKRVLYYRLKQFDFDGKYSYSAIVKVSKETNQVANSIVVFPNPYTSNYSVSFSATTNGQASIEMMDLRGKVITTQTTAVNSGANTIEMLDAEIAQTGVYILRLTINDEVHFIKLVKN